MSMFGWVLNKSKILPKMVILPHPAVGKFYQICTPPLKWKEERFHQTWPHPRYGDFYLTVILPGDFLTPPLNG